MIGSSRNGEDLSEEKLKALRSYLAEEFSHCSTVSLLSSVALGEIRYAVREDGDPVRAIKAIFSELDKRMGEILDS